VKAFGKIICILGTGLIFFFFLGYWILPKESLAIINNGAIVAKGKTSALFY
jgi:hypothetical protein